MTDDEVEEVNAVEVMEWSAPVVRGFAGYDEGGHFVHYCDVCGVDAPFGVKVALRKDEFGIWFCRDHRPGASRNDAQPRTPPALLREVNFEAIERDDDGVPLGRLALAARLGGLEV